MIVLDQSWQVPFDGAFINQGPLSWLARDSSKPQRPADQETWVFHSSVAWAKARIEATKESVIDELIQEAERWLDQPIPKRLSSQAHRWLFARPEQSLAESSLWDAGSRLGACGDWCGGPRVEGALLSGMSLAGQVLGYLHEQGPPAVLEQDAIEPLMQLRLF